MANSFYEHSGYPPGSRARNSSQNLRNEFLAIEAGAQAIEAAIALKADAADLSETQAALELKADAADLSEVDNTSDADKPISTLTQAALDLKADYSALVDFNPATAGADKMLVTNATGDGWEYPAITAAGKALLDDASAAAQRATLGLPSDALTRSRKNLLINGGFDVWQDGTSFTAEGEYYAADCWFLVASRVSSVTLERKEFSIEEFEQYSGKRYYTRVSYALGPSAEDVSYSVRIEDGVRRTAGKTVTLSFLCREAVGKSVYIQYHQYLGGSDYAGEIGTVQFSSSFTRQSVTFEMPSVVGKTFGAGDDSFLEINFIFTERFNTYVPRQSGTFDIGEVQLEFGDAATDFEYRHPAEELALCQRYYEKGTLRGPFAQYNAAYAVGPHCQFLVEKRALPSVTMGALSTYGHDGTPGALYGTNETTRSISPIYNWTGGTIGRSFYGQVTWTADARL